MDQTYAGTETSVGALPAAPVKGRREKVAFISQFRALAILLVVYGHTYDLAWTHFANEDPQGLGSWVGIVPTLVTGATAYFVFISGFLYRHVFFERQSYGSFMYKKLLNVGMPYLLLGSLLALIGMNLGWFTVVLSKEGVPYPHSSFLDYAALMTTGRMMTAYWYVPAIFLIFLASPLFDRFIRLSLEARLAILGLAIVVSLLVLRPTDNLNPVQSAAYVVNFYLLGMIYADNRQRILAFTSRNSVMLALLAVMIGTAAVQTLVLRDAGNIERTWGDGWLPPGLDLMIVQKYAGIFLVCAALSRWGHRLGRATDYLASISFGLFFVHGAVLAVMNRLPEIASPHFGEPLLDLAAYGAVVIAVSVAIVEVARRLTGKYSRHIIGID